VLASISYTFDELIRPDPAGALATSYSLTVSNMLRQLMLTMRHEERAIHQDTAELRAVLREVLDWLEAHDAEGDAIGKLSAALALTVDPATPARSARANWRELRGALEAAIKRMQGLRDAHGQSADYKAARATMRDYLDRSLDREKILIDGAFTLARR
jgi:hypothetical protein